MRHVAWFFCILSLGGCAANSTLSSVPQSGYALDHVARMRTQQAHAIPIGNSGSAASVNPCNGGPAHCHAQQSTVVPPLPNGPNLQPSQIPGYHPADLQSAYAIPAGAQGTTLAIVVAYNDPTAASDLAVYRKMFGIAACTGSCLRFVSQRGDDHLPRSDEGWSAETSIDLDMASAVCPKCSLLVVEANSDNMNDMIAALEEAVKLKPTVISNSWSIPEQYAGPLMGSVFSHPGIAVVAGSGDNGAGVSWPAAEPSIIAVGGTTLERNAATARGWSETPWANAGYGCSSAFAKPAWQTNVPCTTRAIADIAAVADPATGVAIYDSTPQGKGPAASQGGWEVYGGTSVATPIVAGIIADSGYASLLATPQYLYEHAAELNKVLSATGQLQVGLGTPEGSL